MYGSTMSDKYILKTVGETDFYLSEKIDGATHMLIINANAPSNLPALLAIELAQITQDKQNKVGYITSKHALTKPHRMLDERNPMWDIHRYKNTLIAIINSPPVISNAMGAHRNEWLFNYPPARDICVAFQHLEKIGTLTTFALNRLFTEPTPMPKSCVAYKASMLGQGGFVETLQDIWSWLPVQINHMTGGDSTIYIMPSEEAKPDAGRASTSVEPAQFKEICSLLRKDGYNIPRDAAKRAQESYIGLTSEALEAIKELLGSHETTMKDNTGAMYQ